MATITFLVPGSDAGATRGGGVAAPLPGGLSQGSVKQSVQVASRREGSGVVRVSAVPGSDVIVLKLKDGPELVLHLDHARDLLLAQGDADTRGGAAPETATREVTLTPELRWRGLERGLPTRGTTRGSLGSVLVERLDVVTGILKDKAADATAMAIAQRVDAQVDAGLYRLTPEAPLRPLKEERAKKVAGLQSHDKPRLVLVHGTFVETSSTFGKLWSDAPEAVRQLFEAYDGEVYALDHPTLGVSPVANALLLAKSLPSGARLHLLTHSRGGLVAEVLARACGNAAVTPQQLKAFANTQDARDLPDLLRVVKQKAIRVDRIVRVACPARGTLLASKRLDAYVSVFRWTLQLAGVPIAGEIVGFLGEVAQRRSDPKKLPGLSAQIPDSPLVQWLHAVDDAIPGDLRVVAGDIEGDSLTSWLKTLMADAFYWTDNDLVVQTRSMYGGAPRERGATFLLDQGGKVTHFNYFSNERTIGAIVGALLQDAPAAFREIGPLSWSGKSATGFRARRPASAETPASRPAVFVLPGILGSNLKVGHHRIWLGLRIVNGLRRLAFGTPNVEPDGAIESVYDALMEFLAETHEVIEFDYDWRLPIEDEARRLAAAVDAELILRTQSGQPVRMIAHSMGGLVARTMQLENPGVWTRMMSRPGARLVMLGTPNAGSWAPMQVLSGDDTFGNLLIGIGAPFQDKAARDMMAQLPGFIQLQHSLLDASLGLGSEATWRKLADDDLATVLEFNVWHRDGLQQTPYEWGVPKQRVLDQAIALRRRLDDQVASAPGFAQNVRLVVGKARFTPDGYEFAQEGLFYREAVEGGDGRVTVASARIAGVRTWQLDVEHGKLPAARAAFPAFLELLTQGETNRLPMLADREAARAAGAGVGAPAAPRHVLRRPSRERPKAEPPIDRGDVYEAPVAEPRAATDAQAPLPVAVLHGDLIFVRQPLVIGHYRSLRLTGSEWVVDRLLQNRMQAALRVGAYPDVPGSTQAFRNFNQGSATGALEPRPQAVIVVGLGEEGALRPVDLVFAVRQGAIEWARQLTESAAVPTEFDVAATLVGSGGSGISPGQSAQLVAQAIADANHKIREENARAERSNGAREGRRWPRVARLVLVELYLDRAVEAWRALLAKSQAEPGAYKLDNTVRTGSGGLLRPWHSGYRGADYDFISATTQFDANYDWRIAYAVDTRRARTEVHAQQSQGLLLKQLIKDASNAESSDTQIGRSLFQLLVPLGLEPFLGGSTDTVLELDKGTAAIPWELLDTSAGLRSSSSSNREPWAIRTKLLRKLRTANYRTNVADATTDAHVLVIGEPKCSYPRLPAAYEEAFAVATRLEADGVMGAGQVKRLLAARREDEGPDARTVINALLERDWRVIHIAGHGEPALLSGDEPKTPNDPQRRVLNPRGVVLSDGVFLGPREIRSMRVVPELVFVNCCHLAAIDTNSKLIPYSRPEFAASVAEELINIGVRCVIAAGWAVDDQAANVFADRFYDAILRGSRFIDAVAEAREATWQRGGNTWAAYQCYGDPDWVFRRSRGPGATSLRVTDDLADIATEKALLVALDTVAVKSTFQHGRPGTQAQRLNTLENRYASLWGSGGEVAEAFGRAFQEVGDIKRAIEWYERALQANDGKASLLASEQLASLRVRQAARRVDEAWRLVGAAPSRATPAARRSNRAAARKRGSSASVRKAELKRTINGARRSIRAALEDVAALIRVQPTMARESIRGAAYKRLAMIEALGGQQRAHRDAVAKCEEHYRRAEALGRKQGIDTWYPAMNRMAAELAANAGRADWRGLDATEVSAIRDVLTRRATDDPDFWNIVAFIELRVFEALAERRLADDLQNIESFFMTLHERIGAPPFWASVCDLARFVLDGYIGRVTGREREAAEQLRELLTRMATPA